MPHFPPSRLVWAALLLLLTACSLVVERRSQQCETDGDCAQFNNGSVCQQGACVLASQGTCFSGEPTKPEQFRNRCTTADCLPFDNCARVGLCGSASLPALVAPPAP